jgi:hypothetical protein
MPDDDDDGDGRLFLSLVDALLFHAGGKGTWFCFLFFSRKRNPSGGRAIAPPQRSIKRRGLVFIFCFMVGSGEAWICYSRFSFCSTLQRSLPRTSLLYGCIETS